MSVPHHGVWLLRIWLVPDIWSYCLTGLCSQLCVEWFPSNGSGLTNWGLGPGRSRLGSPIQIQKQQREGLLGSLPKKEAREQEALCMLICAWQVCAFVWGCFFSFSFPPGSKGGINGDWISRCGLHGMYHVRVLPRGSRPFHLHQV